ncbi:hypothetical protein BH10CYA1_BH10CYA1_05970 [soil metagenome]
MNLITLSNFKRLLRSSRLALFALCLAGVIVSCIGSSPASAAQVEAWEIRQHTDHFGLTTMLLTPDAVKYVSNNGSLVIIARAPTWKVVAFNKPENLALEMSLDSWPANGMKMFKAKTDLLTAKPTTYFDPALKIRVLQREVPLSGPFYGSNDPAIFRAAEKKQLKSIYLRLATHIPLNDQQKKVLQGLYTLPYCGGFPIELATLTTDGGVTYIYRTSSIAKKQVDTSTFTYPVGYKTTKDRLAVYVTTKQKKRLADFLDAFTEDAANEKKKAESKSGK